MPGQADSRISRLFQEIFMVLRSRPTRNFLAVFVNCMVLVSTPHAQTAAQKAAPASTAKPAVPEPIKSAFDGYRPYTDEAVANWKAANENVARIGGWREYARQAQSSEDTSTRPSRPQTQPATKAAP
jgi:hypothetical protein